MLFWISLTGLVALAGGIGVLYALRDMKDRAGVALISVVIIVCAAVSAVLWLIVRAAGK
jgi:hypothetical protein